MVGKTGTRGGIGVIEEGSGMGMGGSLEGLSNIAHAESESPIREGECPTTWGERQNKPKGYAEVTPAGLPLALTLQCSCLTDVRSDVACILNLYQRTL